MQCNMSQKLVTYLALSLAVVGLIFMIWSGSIIRTTYEMKCSSSDYVEENYSGSNLYDQCDDDKAQKLGTASFNESVATGLFFTGIIFGISANRLE